MGRTRILIVDDEEAVRFGVRDFLEAKNFDVTEAESCAAAEVAFRRSRPDVVLLDYRLPDGTALDLLTRLRRIDGSVPLVVLTAHGSVDLAVRAIKEGAEQFLTKPVELPALHVVLERIVENQRNRQRQLARKSRQARETFDPFIGESSAIRELAAIARKVVTSDSPVLITGPTGSGKGVLARWLHAFGQRADDAFVDLNCAGLSAELLDSELFGHARGAFTTAVKEKTGLLEVAHNGTLFLDEIGDMDIQVQAKLLKVLEEQRFRRVGEVEDRTVDVRLIAATHHDIGRAVQEGRFRSDLFYRINTIQLTVPPLRDRGDDIVVLARTLIQHLGTDLGRTGLALQPDAEEGLRTYRWPGNVRELRNVLERAVLLGEGDALGRRDLRFESLVPTEAASSRTDRTLREVEIDHIERVLREEGGRVQIVANRLGVPKSTLYQKLRAYAIDVAKYRPGS